MIPPDTRIDSSSNVNLFSPTARLSNDFMDLTVLSHKPRKCGAYYGENIRLIPFEVQYRETD